MPAAAVLRCALVAWAALWAFPSVSTATAQDDPAAAAPTSAGPDWRVVVDREHAFALSLPPSHDVARSDGGQWYLHGWHDGSPLVPDVTIAYQPGLTAEEIVARDFPTVTEVSEVALGPGTRGVRVTARYEARDGTPYRTSTYLAEGPDGTYRIDRYEDFDWKPFDAVARSFHFVTFVDDGWPPD